jgi:hypothetical protein
VARLLPDAVLADLADVPAFLAGLATATGAAADAYSHLPTAVQGWVLSVGTAEAAIVSSASAYVASLDAPKSTSTSTAGAAAARTAGPGVAGWVGGVVVGAGVGVLGGFV